ncbi:LarC family nickel insertion protein [Acuticoccus sp. M5D2P5]|uniref:LarC family nickel insertion protein n=1 Tax=Acuticoccus kalidii TaxID=2910977 RepID=UPI001F4629A7|nr:LarC family nickel insertion protein [Acuticoccus kalidii]MCF3933888.1 LarC family nickel insertion protein [Acuticoccus kalidii]
MTAGGHIHLDAVGGAAGDMFVAALLDARPELCPRVFADCAAVLPEGLAAHLEEGTSGGLSVRRFRLAGEAGHHVHAHHDDHDDHHGHHAHATSYAALRARIEAAPLAEGTAAEACAILHRIAEAEAKVHAIPIERVHFHELADWDSLMDVVAAGSIAAALSAYDWSVSPLPLGHGFIATAHGRLPVPAPATAELLRGFPTVDDGIGGERVTPTGAAILAHLCRPGVRPAGGIVGASGFGAGTRELPGMANVLRALVYETAETPRDLQADEVGVITFDIDDMTGEEIAVAVDHLRAADGVLDVSLAARIGKKGRPMEEVRLLTRPDRVSAIARLCLDETSTIGLRWRIEQRYHLPRVAETHTSGGMDMRAKRVIRPDGRETVKIESDDVAGLSGLAARRAARSVDEPVVGS